MQHEESEARLSPFQLTWPSIVLRNRGCWNVTEGKDTLRVGTRQPYSTVVLGRGL